MKQNIYLCYARKNKKAVLEIMKRLNADGLFVYDGRMIRRKSRPAFIDNADAFLLFVSRKTRKRMLRELLIAELKNKKIVFCHLDDKYPFGKNPHSFRVKDYDRMKAYLLEE